ncbi:hypothetical protein LOC67_17145 [Stieleria sp. JC731]|uniref:hypothetical protein n=1 Tax=Pirellulaceae TaxID=2691357 RepID=UPI001E3F39DE|nr:hypothetical protein [Stieleria sp. JC731]MCC9602283.1 hypothetical protein [Stieleria sp. JC731]
MTKQETLFFLIVYAVTFFLPAGALSQDTLLTDKTRTAVKPTIQEIEAVMLGREHKPLKDFVANDAIFEEADSPLIDYLERTISREASSETKSFPAKSRLFWAPISESPLLPMFKRYRRLDPDRSILVFREIDRSNGRLKALGFDVQQIGGRWKVVLAFEGTGPEDQLSRNASLFGLGR